MNTLCVKKIIKKGFILGYALNLITAYPHFVDN